VRHQAWALRFRVAGVGANAFEKDSGGLVIGVVWDDLTFEGSLKDELAEAHSG
jgi:hypothetical protein